MILKCAINPVRSVLYPVVIRFIATHHSIRSVANIHKFHIQEVIITIHHYNCKWFYVTNYIMWASNIYKIVWWNRLSQMPLLPRITIMQIPLTWCGLPVFFCMISLFSSDLVSSYSLYKFEHCTEHCNFLVPHLVFLLHYQMTPLSHHQYWCNECELFLRFIKEVSIGLEFTK